MPFLRFPPKRLAIIDLSGREGQILAIVQRTDVIVCLEWHLSVEFVNIGPFLRDDSETILLNRVICIVRGGLSYILVSVAFIDHFVRGTCGLPIALSAQCVPNTNSFFSTVMARFWSNCNDLIVFFYNY